MNNLEEHRMSKNKTLKNEIEGSASAPILPVNEKLIASFKDIMESWGRGLDFAVKKGFDGKDTDWDFSKIRKKGSALKTKGDVYFDSRNFDLMVEIIREKCTDSDYHKK